MGKRYVGLDLHARQSTMAILEDGEEAIRTRTLHGSLRSVLAEVVRVKPPFEVCYEASTGYGVVYEALVGVADRVAVGHPAKLRLIFGSKDKHNRADAKRLARLLRAGFVPEVHVPPREVRRWRALIQRRRRHVVERSGVKSALRFLLRSLGIEAPKSLWSRAGLAWVGTVGFDDASDALMRDEHLAHLEYLNGAIGRAERRLDEVAMVRWADKDHVKAAAAPLQLVDHTEGVSLEDPAD